MSDPTPLVTASRDTLADALGAMSQAYNVTDCTDEATTYLPAMAVEDIADALLASGVVRAVDGLVEDEALVERVADAFDEWLFRMHGVTSSCDHKTEARGILAALATPTDPSEA